MEDYESSPPELGYMDIATQAGEMRYPQDTTATSITIDPPQQPPLLSLFPSHPPTLNSTTVPFAQDGGTFSFQPPAHTQIYPGLDIRSSRLGSNSTSSIGMAHTHLPRAAPLPHPGPQITTREQYSHSIPSYRRDHPHSSRSPSFAPSTLRRHPLSPTASPMASFTAPSRMSSTQYGGRPNASANIPPLMELQVLGVLSYSDGTGTHIKPDISGTIDKGFFLSDHEWTCYRRNYFNCVCSFQLSPHYPGTPIQFTPTGSNQTYQVFGFAMCISAVVSDNESHTIELVQHTPKRDKGPVMKPDKIRLGAKQPQPTHHHPMGMYSDGLGPSRGIYADSFASQSSGQQHPTEHTFERIQFKQATQNNGKRRAAQQYYQLVVELWADVGNQTSGNGGEQFVKVAQKKSAKMIVRGRSPGHYQNDRRGSQSGSGGASGSMGGYAPVTGMGDFGPNPMLGGASYATGFEGRSLYSVRHHDIPHESMIPAEDMKAVDTTKEYQYFPGSMYESHADRVDMFPRTEAEMGVPHMTTGLDINAKMKSEYDGTTLPSIFQPPLLVGERRPGPFEGKSSSTGYYPTHYSPSGVNLTMS